MKYNVKCGADRNDKIFELISGKRCGLLTAASGVDSQGVPTYYKLFEQGALSVLFAPEHGVHSVLQDGGWSGSYVDKETGFCLKTGADLPFPGDIKDAVKKLQKKEASAEEILAAAENYADDLNTTYVGIANSLITMEYYEGNKIKYISS